MDAKAQSSVLFSSKLNDDQCFCARTSLCCPGETKGCASQRALYVPSNAPCSNQRREAAKTIRTWTAFSVSSPASPSTPAHLRDIMHHDLHLAFQRSNASDSPLDSTRQLRIIHQPQKPSSEGAIGIGEGLASSQCRRLSPQPESGMDVWTVVFGDAPDVLLPSFF